MAQPTLVNRIGSLWTRIPAADATSLRNQAFWRTLVSAYGLKIVSISSNLISVPLAARYLGPERYGLWVTMGSFIGVLGLCEFGMGNNLTTLLAQARGRGDMSACARYVSATFWLVIATASALFIVFSVVQPWLSWTSIFNVKGFVATAEPPRAAFLIGLIAAMQLVAGLCGRIYSGLQQGYFGSLWQAGAMLVGLLALVLTCELKGGLVMLVIALGLVPIVVQLVGLAWVLRTAECGQLVWPSQLTRGDFRTVIGGSGLMFAVNLQSIFWLSKDNLLIAHTLDLNEVGRYNTAWRIYTAVFGLLAGAVGSALWPAYADAYSRADFSWIRRMLRKAVLLGTLGMLAFAILFVFSGPLLLQWYVGKALSVGRVLLLWMGAYFLILTVVNLLSYTLLAIGRPHVIAFGGVIGGVLSVPVGIVAVERVGSAWALVATNLLCTGLFILLPLWWDNHRRALL